MVTTTVVTILNVITSVSILFVLASGLMVIFGLLGVVNLAHGEFIMIGVYCGYVTAALGLDPWLSFVIAPLAVAVLGVLVEWVLIRRLYGKLMESVLATWGLAIVLQQIIELAFGKEYKQVPYPTEATVSFLGTIYPVYRLVYIVVAVAIGAIFVVVQRKTNLGVTVRAVVSNKERAASVGVHVNRVYRGSFVVGSALAGLAGALLGPSVSAYSTVGSSLLIDSFLAVLVAGQPTTAVLAASSSLLGGTSSVVGFFLDPIWGSVSLVLVALIVLRFRRAPA